jgi:hypothetical protein
MVNILDLKLPKGLARALGLPDNDPRRQQLRVLNKLLKRARFTAFGQQYRFDDILLSRHVGKVFQELVPVHDYNKIYEEWWQKPLKACPTLPGRER